jgi:hypothetical protein
MNIPLIGEVDGQRIIDFLRVVLVKLEGEYKWYVIALVGLAVMALITKFIFKTVKWFFILVLIGIFMFGVFWALGYFLAP